MARGKSSKSKQEVTPKTEGERAKALDMAMKQIEKQFGKGAILRMGEEQHIETQTIPSGALSLDIALGIGGLPKGRIVEIFGPESSGKTTVALHAVAECQKQGGIAAFIDAEHALDPVYAEKIGVDIDNLLISQPDHGEQALEICEALARSGAVDIIVLDSVAALVPKAEIDGEMGDVQVGAQARLMSQALRKLAGVTAKSETLIIFINQLREKIGVMFGSPETTTGGRALKFYSSVRLDVRRIETLRDGSDMIGNRTRVKVVKNKVAPPFKSAEFDMLYGEGISKEGAILDLAVEKKLIQKSGAWYNYGEMRIAQGRDNTRVFLKDNPELTQKLDKQLRAMFEEERKQAIAAQEAKRQANQSVMAAAEAAQAPAARPAAARPAVAAKPAPAAAVRKPAEDEIDE